MKKKEEGGGRKSRKSSYTRMLQFILSLLVKLEHIAQNRVDNKNHDDFSRDLDCDLNQTGFAMII